MDNECQGKNKNMQIIKKFFLMILKFILKVTFSYEIVYPIFLMQLNIVQ